MTRRVVLTSAEGSFPDLAASLADCAATIVARPLLQFAPPEDRAPLAAALAALDGVQALVVTSPRGAAAVQALLGARPLPPTLAVWVAGPATAAALGVHGASARWPAETAARAEGTGAALADAMLAAGVRGPVLFVCGDRRRDELPARLRSAGVPVHEVVGYRTVPATAAAAAEAAEAADLLVVASPSVATLLAGCGAGHRPPLVAVGPTTAQAAEAAGWPPDAVTDAPTTAALAACLRRLLSSSCP